MADEIVTNQGDGEIVEFQGTTLDKPIVYAFSWKSYPNVDAARASEDWPSAGEILKFVNTRSKNSAKAQSYQKATADLRKAYEETPEFKRKQFVTATVAAGVSEAKANELADSLGL